MPATHCQIVIVQPEGYLHAQAFRELAETLLFALQHMGVPASISVNEVDGSAVNLILGWHLLGEEAVARLPELSILYNLEQLDDRNRSLLERLLALKGRFEVWDYSRRNLDILQENGCPGTLNHVPVGFVAELSRIPKAPQQDIDVLFYGSVNDRRAKVLDSLKARGLKVEHVFGIYGPERDGLIARSKVVLNMHYYDSSIFEIVRVSYLLANRKAVVAECHPGTEVDPNLREAVRAVPYEHLVEACQDLVRNEGARMELEARGFGIFSSFREEDILGRILGRNQPADGSVPASVPDRLNIGSGKDWKEDCLNADINPSWGPDLLLDLCQPLDPRKVHPTSRFGPLRLGLGSFQEILANDVLEHLPDLPTAMGNCLALLREGGRFHIQVPYDLSHGAWQDPTHVRAFNERSWLYYTDWFWYLGWTEARFELEALTYLPSELGQELVAKGQSQEDVLRTPRAIDAMRVVLRKRALTSSERELVLSFRRRPGAVTSHPQAAAPPPPMPAAQDATDARSLYLDLMERCLLNLIYEDAPQDPWSGGAFNPDLRAGGRDWPSVAHTMIGQRRMANLRQLAEAVIRDGVPGDFIETGVWRGGACIYLRAILKAHGIRDRKVFVADSFEGLPEPDPERYPADRGDLHHTFMPLAISLEEVQSNFGKYGLLDDQVMFLKGWFKDTLPVAPIQHLALLRLDGDMYESTMDGLVNLYDKVSPGGFVIVDDFGAVKACAQAIHDFRASRGISDPIQDIDGIGVFWKKTR